MNFTLSTCSSFSHTAYKTAMDSVYTCLSQSSLPLIIPKDKEGEKPAKHGVNYLDVVRARMVNSYLDRYTHYQNHRYTFHSIKLKNGVGGEVQGLPPKGVGREGSDLHSVVYKCTEMLYKFIRAVKNPHVQCVYMCTIVHVCTHMHICLLCCLSTPVRRGGSPALLPREVGCRWSLYCSRLQKKNI